MSEPKRYTISGLHPHIYENKEGFMVYYEDYARLKAEVERLKMEESKLLTLCETYEGDLERLRKFNDEALAHIAKEERKSRECLDMAQADVERLIKAGDKLVEAIQEMDVIIDMDSEHPEVNAWNAAKEASQA